MTRFVGSRDRSAFILDPAEAWRRGRALIALGRLQAQARQQERDTLSMKDVIEEVKSARKIRRKRERGS